MSNFITKEEYEEYFETDSVKRKDELESKFDDRLDDLIIKIYQAHGYSGKPDGFWYDNVSYEKKYINIGDMGENEYTDLRHFSWDSLKSEYLFSDDFIQKIKNKVKDTEQKKVMQKQKRQEYTEKRKLVDAELKVYEKQLKQKYGIK